MSYGIEVLNAEFNIKDFIDSIKGLNNGELYTPKIPNNVRDSKSLEKYLICLNMKIMYDISKERNKFVIPIALNKKEVDNYSIIVLTKANKLPTEKLVGKLDLITSTFLHENLKDDYNMIVQPHIYAKTNDPSYFSDIKELIKKHHKK